MAELKEYYSLEYLVDNLSESDDIYVVVSRYGLSWARRVGGDITYCWQ